MTFSSNRGSITMALYLAPFVRRIYYDLEVRVRITQGHRKWYHLTVCRWFPVNVL